MYAWLLGWNGNVYQADTFKVIVRVYLDATLSGDQATVGLTATSKNDPTVSETTFLTVASPAPFLQAFNDTQQSAMDLEYIQPNANFTMNAGQPNNFQSWSPSVAKGPNGYVYAWDADRCSQPDCQYNYSEIYVAITDFQGRLLYPVRKVTDHALFDRYAMPEVDDVYDRTVVPVVAPEVEISV